MGRWLITLHRAFIPQEPAHGSLHLLPTHDNVRGQSWSIKHSGRQFGGAPNIPGRHEHTARLSETLQSAFDPHGDGIQGDTGGVGNFSEIMKFSMVFVNFKTTGEIKKHYISRKKSPFFSVAMKFSRFHGSHSWNIMVAIREMSWSPFPKYHGSHLS